MTLTVMDANCSGALGQVVHDRARRSLRPGHDLYTTQKTKLSRTAFAHAELLDAEHRYDVLQLVVPGEGLTGRSRHAVVAIADDRPLEYEEIALLVGQGNFVATLCRARWKDTPYAQADLFRIEDGLIVEHWDAAEPIGPESEWVNSGKF